LFLQQHGTALDEKHHERAAVYLTNALTGWQPPVGPKQKLLFPEMEEERDKAERVKQQTPLLVVLGNPPYNGFAGLPADEEAGLVEPYRTTKAAPRPQGQGLNDLYVRFFRVAERCVTERQAKHGIVCYISNYSWLDGLSHTGLRERFLAEFDQVWIGSLNGDKYKTGKTTPDGKPDPSVFSTPHNREGIQVGTAVALLARTPAHHGPAKIHFRDFWGETKREDLLASGKDFQPEKYSTVKPVTALGLAFRPMKTEVDYTNWPLLTELFPTSFPGVKTSRDEALVDIDREALVGRMRAYFDPALSHQEMTRIAPKLMTDASRFVAIDTRNTLRLRGILSDHFVRFLYRPFDVRWLYWEPLTKLLDEKRTEYFPHVYHGNSWLSACQQNRKEFDPPIVCSPLAAIHIIERTANMFPMLLKEWPDSDHLFAEEARNARRLGNHFANLSDAALTYLSTFQGVADAPHLFHLAIAVLHAPEYAAENGAALRQDWPRVPLPASREDLLASADLGRRVAALLDPEALVDGVTAGKVRPELKTLGVATRLGGGQLDGADFAVTARWGIIGKGGVTMPGPGRHPERAFTPDEAAALGESGVRLLGPDTVDVFLNEAACWRNVPRRVWEYTLGGYQVLKKWLSYREQAILGRPLTVDEVGYVTQVVRRIAALLLLGPDLDANYRRPKAATYPWPRSNLTAASAEGR